MAGTIKIIAGTDYSDTITLTEADGVTPRDITGHNIKFKIAKTTGITDAAASYFAQTDDATDFVITTAASGICTILIPDSVTKDFKDRTFQWQIRDVNASGIVQDTDQGICEVDLSLFDNEP